MGNILAEKPGCPPVDFNFFENKNINLFIFQGYNTLEDLLQDLQKNIYLLRALRKHPSLAYVLMTNFNYYLLQDFFLQKETSLSPQKELLAYYRRNLYKKGLPSTKSKYHVTEYSYDYRGYLVSWTERSEYRPTGSSGDSES